LPAASPLKSKSRQITLAAVFAVVYFILRSVPTFQMIGIAGSFTAGDFVLTTLALIGGLWSGALAVVAGTILAYASRAPLFYGLDFLPALLNVAIVTLIVSKRHHIAQAAYLIVLLAFVVSPYSLTFAFGYIPYTWLHLVALVLLFSPLTTKVPRWLHASDFHQFLAVLLLAFVGTMAQHLMGGLLFELTLGMIGGIDPLTFRNTIWYGIFFVYPEERLLITALSTIIAAAVLASTRKWFVHIPSTRDSTCDAQNHASGTRF